MAKDKPTLLLPVPVDGNNRASTASTNSALLSLYADSLTASQPSSPVDSPTTPNQLRRRSLSTRSSDNEELQEFRREKDNGWTPRHTPNASTSSSADIVITGVQHMRSSSTSSVDPQYQNSHYDQHDSIARPFSTQSYGLDDTGYYDPFSQDVSTYDSRNGPEEEDIARLTENADFLSVARADGQQTFPPANHRSPSQRKYHPDTRRRYPDANLSPDIAFNADTENSPHSPPSPISRRRSIMENAARELRRISVRVVNVHHHDHSQSPIPPLPDEVNQDEVVDHQDYAQIEESTEAPATGIGTSASPLLGRTLGIFGPENHVRRVAHAVLLSAWTEPIILALIVCNVVVLTIQAAPDVFSHPRPTSRGYFFTWEDWALFVLMVIFTLEIVMRVIVSGLLFNASTYLGKRGATEEQTVTWNHVKTKVKDTAAALGRGPTLRRLGKSPSLADRQKQRLAQRTEGSMSGPFQLSVFHQHEKTPSQTAYLRHSYNRIDLVAVLCFWTAFALAFFGYESKDWLYIFRALSVLRAARLLTLTAGTMTILQSLKRAGPMLVNVAFFVLFAMVLFSVIGVQSFKGSYRRQCVWIDPGNVSNYSTGQLCGGFVDALGGTVGYIASDQTTPNGNTAKGYVCPQGQLCLEGESPFNGTSSFDNFASAVLQVVVIVSCNGWSTSMYEMMAADYFVSCLFFIICLIVLNFWLINMFVAVITNTFSSIVDETKHSAFASDMPAPIADGDQRVIPKGSSRRRADLFRRCVKHSRLFWVALVLADVSVQATRTNDISATHARLLDMVEKYMTIAFDVEIVLRFTASLPEWRDFFRHPTNNADLCLAVVCSIIQIPPIHEASVYRWFTAFQLARFYRVMLAIPRIRRLLVKITGSVAGLVNMILFLFMMTFVATLLSIQFLRGELPAEIEGEEVQMTFSQIYNAFLGVYQVLTSENWTTVLFSATGSAYNTFNIVLAAAFLSGWFLFANFIMVQMFIAVINEGFALAEGDKHEQQLERFRGHKKKKAPPAIRFLDKWNPYRHVKPRKTVMDALVLGRESFIMPSRKPNDTDSITTDKGRPNMQAFVSRTSKPLQRSFTSTSKFFDDSGEDDMFDVRHHLNLLSARPLVVDEDAELERDREAAEVQFIEAHPSYDRALWIWSQDNWWRRFVQTFVEPGYGKRIHGAPPQNFRVALFKLVILSAVIGSIAVAAIATPVYRQAFFIQYGDIRFTWFNLTEISLGMFFIAEFMVKVTADGFLWAPNAYLLSIWNCLDFFVMLTLIVNVTTALINGGGVSRATRAMKAFRALRLINFLRRTRVTFYDVLISGAGKLFDASVLAILYIIPYAIWGQNVFAGLLYYCNDSNAANKIQCVGEYLSSPLQWEFLAPRAWINPYVWSFDAFHNSFLILFEIISLEGWINVLQSTSNIVGLDQQPSPNAGQFNSIFLVLYILVGGIFILALFVTIIIANFTNRSGLALLTAEQRQWIDLRKLILRQRPTRRPRFRPLDPVRAWCFDRSVQKHGWWSRMLTVFYVLHIILLATQATDDSALENSIRDVIFLLLTFVYALDIFVKITGVGWLNFSKNWWNLYDVAVVTGTFATTIPVLLNTTNQVAIQLQKLFLVSIAFKLVQKNNSLNQLFKTAVGSLPAIGNLFLLWSTLFFVWAIADIEVFSLTRWMANETYNANFSTFAKTLVMLVFSSTGEAWNAFMHDFTVKEPYCTPSDNYLFSDCGSPSWAFGLFISWNVISMYIFMNMFTGVVVENFAYVFQLYGRVKSVNREEMRAFKKAWAELDLNRTGYLRRRQFVPFFARLSGVFDIKIYTDDVRLPGFLQACIATRGLYGRETTPNIINGIDLTKLRNKVDGLDAPGIRQRRARYNRIYHEAILAEEPGKGVSFTNMLLLLAQYKLIDNNALTIEERLQREAKMQQVDDLVGLDRVRSLMRTLYFRRAFLDWQIETRQQNANVPHITIEATGDSPKLPPAINTNLQLPARNSIGESPPHSPSSPTYWARDI